ncbi:Nephrin [Portunus trituberculatus]|uniref:Nephrin n=1 Tax=Portunus trituberculatus TaxID=210409 RepID=A0A5B7FD23_PORTR|nr:Nephrin [Portunus trituberculatus]
MVRRFDVKYKEMPPMSIRLLGVDGAVSAGVGVTLVCMVVGARPAPTVTWWLDGRPQTARDERMLQNNVTESHMVLVATPEDQGRYLSCRAETPGLLQSSLEDGVKLTVHCEYECKSFPHPPLVTLLPVFLSSTGPLSTCTSASLRPLSGPGRPATTEGEAALRRNPSESGSFI